MTGNTALWMTAMVYFAAVSPRSAQWVMGTLFFLAYVFCKFADIELAQP